MGLFGKRRPSGTKVMRALVNKELNGEALDLESYPTASLAEAYALIDSYDDTIRSGIAEVSWDQRDVVVFVFPQVMAAISEELSRRGRT